MKNELNDEQKAAIRAARAQWAREYRKKNPQKIREIGNRYWLRRAERLQREQQDGETDKGE